MKGDICMYKLMQALETKTFLGALVMMIAYVSDSMHEVFVILAVFMIIDYITGIICGLVKNGGFNNKKGIMGAVKKLSYLILILITILTEYLINYLTEASGFNIKTGKSITLAVYIYLIGTEGLSIIQNLIILGIPVPQFMIKLFGLVRDESGNVIRK